MEHLARIRSFSAQQEDNFECIDFWVVKIEFFKVFVMVGNNFFLEQMMYCKG